MSVLKSTSEGNVSTYMFGMCLFCTFIEIKVFFGLRDIYYAKKIKHFCCVEVRILVEMRNVVVARGQNFNGPG